MSAPGTLRPDLDAPDSWLKTLEAWRADPDSVLDLSNLGTADEPVPGELLTAIPSIDGQRRIGHIDLSNSHLSELDWTGVIFGAELDARSAKFGADFRGAQFRGDATFARARFMTNVAFRAAKFDKAADFAEARFSDDPYFVKSQFEGEAYFNESSFDASANFNEVRFASNAYFRLADFSSDSTFIKSRFDADAEFGGAAFQSNVCFDGTYFELDASFPDARFAADIGFNDLQFGDPPLGGLVLIQAAFVGTHHEVAVSLNEESSMAHGLGLVLVRARIEGDLLLRLGRECVLDGLGLTVRAPMSVAELYASSAGLITRLDDADITASFRIGRHIDLSHTTWGDQDLTAVTITDTTTLPRTGALHWLQQRDNFPEWARAIGDGRRILAADRSDLDRIQLSGIEGNYRDLRRQLEATGNNHGANDFYYGEMEARRRQRSWLSADRWLLETYRAVSGYGTRFWPALVAWVLLTLLAAQLLSFNGIDISEPRQDLSFGEVWRFTLEASLSFFRPTAAPQLSVPETIMVTVVRILGPVLIALSALAVRNRTKR